MASTKRRSEAIWIESKKYWQVKVQRDGARRAFTSSTPGRRGKHEAEGKADEWLESGKEDVRFGAAWASFMEYQKEHTGTSNYTQNESMGRLWIQPNIRSTTKVSAITPIMWQKCVDAPNAKGKSKRTCKNVRTTITSFLAFCRRNRWAVQALVKGDVTIPKNAPVGKRKVLQPDTLRKFFEIDYIIKWRKKTPSFYIHAWRFIVLTGLRRGELCGIKNEDFDGNVLHIQRAINAQNEITKGKNENAERYILLTRHAQAELEAQREMLKKASIISPWTFPNEDGSQTNSNHLYSMWDTYRNQHALGCSLHELRHTLISLAKNDMPEQLLKALVGHSESMDTFGTYGHEVDGDMQRTANILDSIFDRLFQ